MKRGGVVTEETQINDTHVNAYRPDICTCAAGLPGCPSCRAWSKAHGARPYGKLRTVQEVDQAMEDARERLTALEASGASHNRKRFVRRTLSRLEVKRTDLVGMIQLELFPLEDSTHVS